VNLHAPRNSPVSETTVEEKEAASSDAATPAQANLPDCKPKPDDDDFLVVQRYLETHAIPVLDDAESWGSGHDDDGTDDDE